MSEPTNELVVQRPPPRVRERPPEEVAPEDDHMEELIRDLAMRHGGMFPKKADEFLTYISQTTIFPDDVLWECRSAVLNLWIMQGVPVPEICRRLNKSVRTVWRWIARVREDNKRRYSQLDPLDVHADFLNRDSLLEERLFNELGRAKDAHETVEIVRAWVQKNKLRLAHLRMTGLYDALSIHQSREGQSEREARHIRDALRDAFQADVLEAELGGVDLPTLEGTAEDVPGAEEDGEEGGEESDGERREGSEGGGERSGEGGEEGEGGVGGADE